MTGNEPLPGTVRTLAQAITCWTQRTPDAPVLEAPRWEPVTYAQLWQTIGRLRSQLHAAGIGRGTRLALLLPDGLPLTLLSLAAISTTTLSTFDSDLREPERERLLAHLDIHPLLTCEPRNALGRRTFGSPRTLTLRGTSGPCVEDMHVVGQPVPDPVDRSWSRAEDTADLFHTSGTTGEPRPVPKTNDSYMTWAHASVRAFELSPRDRTVGLASLAYAAGAVPLRHALVAGSVFVSSERSTLGSLLDHLDAFAPTWLYLPAGMVHLLDDALEREPARRLPASLRFVRFTSAAIRPETLARLERRFGIPIYPEYSSTEAGVIARVSPPPATRKPGSVGVPFLEVRIVDESDGDLPAGAEGEIVVRGPTVMRDEPAASAERKRVFLPSGCFRAGDLGFLDRDGFLFVTGRKREIINRGGAKIAPVEVDHTLLRHPAVAEAAVFAVPDARLGEDIVAAVVLRPNMTASQRERRCWMLDRLSLHKVPRRIWMVDALPRTRTGKVQRGELARRWSETRG